MFAASVAGYLLLIAGQPLADRRGRPAGGQPRLGLAGCAQPGRGAAQPRRTRVGVGATMTGLFGGAIAGPVAIGVLAENDLWAAAWIGCAVFALLAAATVIAAPRHEARAAAELAKACARLNFMASHGTGGLSR